jgi:hypothetical protein
MSYESEIKLSQEVDSTDRDLLGDFIAQVQTEMENLEDYADEVHMREYDMRAVAIGILLPIYSKMCGN